MLIIYLICKKRQDGTKRYFLYWGSALNILYKNNRLTQYKDTNTTGQQKKQYITIKQVQKQKT